MGLSVWMTMRWAGVSMKPAPRTPVAALAASRRSLRVRSKVASFSGLTWICSCSTSPPKTLAWATPGTARRRGFRVQSTKVRRSRPDIFSAMRPIFNKSMVDEVSGERVGARALSGSWPVRVPSFSAMAWRARWMSALSLKTAVTTLRPWMLSERTESRSEAPLTAFSTGRVTRTSTWSAERPGASVWIVTWGWTNSGKTSSGARRAVRVPWMSTAMARTITRLRWRRERRTRRLSMGLVDFGSGTLGFEFLAEQGGGSGGDDDVIGG